VVGAREEDGIDGDVVDSDGKSIPGAVVSCKLGERELTAGTDESGRFHFDSDARSCHAIASKRGHRPSEEEVLRAGSQNRLHLRRATGIAGNVVDDIGSPVPAFWIGVAKFTHAGAADAGAALPRRFEDVEGAFEMSDVEPGRYELVVMSVPPGPMVRSPPIEVAQDALTKDVRIALHPGATITGRVTDAATHAPIDGATVFGMMGGLSTRQPKTRDGNYKLEDAPSGPFELRVMSIGYLPRVVSGLEAPPGGQLRVDVSLEPLPR
jgi:hypothetical protein